MARVPASVPRLPIAPTWRFKGTGAKTLSEVLLGGDRVAELATLATLLRWTSLALEVSFHRHVEPTAPRTDPRVAKALAAVRTLAAAAKWTFGGTMNLYGVGAPSARSAKTYSATGLLGAAKAHVLTSSTKHEPAAFARTGGADDVQYDWQLVVGTWTASLHGPPTPAGAAALARIFDALRANDAVTVVTLGHGHAGILSAKSFRDGTLKANGPFGSTQWVAAAFAKHDAELLAPIHRGHVGPGLLELPRARELAGKLAAASPSSVLDAHGLLWTAPAPATPTERKPAALADAKRFTTLVRALHAEIAKDFTRKADARRKQRSRPS